MKNALGNSSHLDLKFLVMFLALGAAIFHLSLAFSGRGLSRDQHLGTAVEYAKTQIDMLHPIILGANANGAPTPLELPVWQAATALLMKVFGRWYGWGNVASLLFHFSTLWPLFHLAQGLFSTRVGWWALLFYLAQPLTFLWGGLASADAMAASFASWFVYFGWHLMNANGWAGWPAAATIGTLSATTKAPMFMVAGLTLFFWLLYQHRQSRIAWLKLVSVGVISTAIFLLWNHHANRCYEAAEFPFFDLRTGSGKPIMTWWLGDWAGRLDLRAWGKGIWRVTTILLGSLGLMLLPVAGWFAPGTAPLRLWIVAGICAVLVFTNVILVHWHYYYIFSFPVALLCARAASQLEPAVWQFLPNGIVSRIGLLLLIAALSLGQGLQAAHLNLYQDPYLQDCGRSVREHTLPTDKTVIWGTEWTGPLLRAERQGVTIADFSAVTDPAKLGRLKQMGYNKLVLINTSPLQAAISTVSGSHQFKIKDLQKELPAVAQSWPVVFQSTSLLILEIPK